MEGGRRRTTPPELRDEDVVISGLAGLFPNSDSIDELRENLFNSVDLVTEDNCRWKMNNELGVPNATGKIRHASRFDNAHFGIHRKQVLSLDPMICIVLEKSFEALCDAGVSPASVKGRNIGVYMGSTNSEADNLFDYEGGGDGFGIVGHNRSMLSTRVSYYLDISGPSLTEMSSWSVGMTALTNAYRDIKSGRCEAALVGAPNLSLMPVMSWHLAQLGILSDDAKCRAFDDAANGHGRSDSVVVMYLQRASQAKRVYSSIVHADYRCYGARGKYTKPMGHNMTRLLSQFYDECGVDPASVTYLEAEGSGTKLDDREELNAVDDVLLRNRKTPLLIGTVKSNLGHTEAASSLVALTKVIIAMESGFIPPNLHYTTPNSEVPALVEGRLQVVTKKTPYPGGLAAVNSIGIDGNYSHLLMKPVARKKNNTYDGLPRLLTVCGRTETGVQMLLTKVQSMAFDMEYIRLLQDVHVENIVGHIYRGFTILEPEKKNKLNVVNYPGKKRSIWFVYSGMGSQWAGMGKQLMRLPIFKAAIERCHAILEPKGLDLIHIITTQDPKIFDSILHCFVGIAAVQIGLTNVLTALDIKPDGIIGHSVGELGCAYVDGCMTADEMILSAYARGRASIETKLAPGMMAAVGLGYSQIKDMLPPGVEIACHNSAESSTLSGPPEAVADFVAVLQGKGIFARSVNVANIAYHSQYIKPAAPRLLELLKEIIPTPRQRSPRWISTSVPESRWDTPLSKSSSPDYHTNNLLSSVLFEEGSRHIPRNAITIEIAPHGLLQAILRRSLGDTCTNVALTQRGEGDGLEILQTAIGNLYLLGLQPKVSELYPPVQFPVGTGTPAISPLISWEHTEDWPILLGTDLLPGHRWVVLSMTQEEVRSYGGHSLGGKIVVPAAAYLKYVWELFAGMMTETLTSLPVVFENVRIHKTALIPEKGSLELYLLLQRGSGNFEVVENLSKEMLATGKISMSENIAKEFVATPDVPSRGAQLEADDVYKELEQRGYQLTGLYRSITSIVLNEHGSVSRTLWQQNWEAFISSMMQQSILQTAEREQDLQLPASIQRIVIDPLKHSAAETDFEVVSHLHSSVILGGGVEIQGLKTKLFETPAASALSLNMDTLKLVAYKTPRLPSVKEFVSVSVQLAVENSRTAILDKAGVTIVDNTGDKFSMVKQIEECLSQYPRIQVDVKTSCPKNKSMTKHNENSFLVVVNPHSLAHGAKHLGSAGGFLLTRVDNADAWQCGEDVTVVLEQQFGRGKFVLLRKRIVSETSPVVINIDEDAKTWIEMLRASVKSGREVVLVTREEPPCGVQVFVERMLAEPSCELIRCVLLLDKSAPKFSLSEPLYRSQLESRLLVNIYQNNIWGSIRHQSLAEDRLLSAEHSELPLPSLTLDGIELKYLGLNKKDSSQCTLSHVDFSGRSDDSRWVMGVARVGSATADPTLTWPVPDSWSMDEAATVPLAYATAYYALVLTCNTRPRQRVLIHEGCSAVGQAAIAVALDIGCRLFITVATAEQKQFLLTKHPQLNAEHIYSSKNLKFEVGILSATKSKGADIVLNTLQGKYLQASLRCVANFGKFVQLGRSDLEKNSTIGMLVFNRSVALFGVATDNLFNTCVSWKRLLHDAVQRGVENGVVLPLEQRVFMHQQYDRALEMLADDDQWYKVLLNVRDANRATNFMQSDVIPRLQLDPSRSYLVVGGSLDMWLELSEWLLRRGAAHLLIAQQTRSSYVTRRVSLLRTNHRATVVLTTSDDANALVTEAEKLAPLAGIFILPIAKARETQQNGLWVAGSSNLRTARHLDTVSRRCRLHYFVCLLCAGAETVCAARRQGGHAALAVHWRDDARRLTPTLATLDRLLGSGDEHSVVLSATAGQRDELASTLTGSSSRLSCFLPAGVEALSALAGDVTRLVQVRTMSPGLADVREVPPVFVIPGLSGAGLNLLTDRLMYPGVCVRLPRGGASMQQMAEEIAQKVRHVQPSGPYNLVGDSWGGALALEVARRLEALGERTQLFLLEGAPDTCQHTFSQLGEGSVLQDNLLCRMMSIKDDKVRVDLRALSDWESKLSLALTHSSTATSESERRRLEAAATSVYEHVNALLQYRPQEGAPLTGLVTLFRPLGEEDDNCGLIKLCRNTVTVHLVGEGRDGMLSSLQTSDIIGENVLVQI